ncbi:DNA-primase RepB domain-containing protein [Nitratireductor aquimarinus]|uniref:DNA-primase RepB domain-containing protein n=1 Tax=Nitratireductor aquimarinus TaxID=889300 RepID=UPI00398EF3DE
MFETMQLPTPKTDVAIAFLKVISPNRWDLAAIPPDGGRPEFKTFLPTELSEAENWIEVRQGVSGLYYQVNEVRAGLVNRKAAKADIARVLHLHADIDVNDKATLLRIRSFVPAPTVVIFSGGGFQPLWTLLEPSTEVDRVERINTAIASALGGDNCHNVDRLLRLPGTINMPNAKKRAAGRVPTLARIV